MEDYAKIEELLFEVADSEKPELYDNILDLLKQSPPPVPQHIKDCINMLIESWQLAPDESAGKTNFLIKVSAFFKNDFPELRSSLSPIIKKTLPANFNKSTSIKALGIRNENIYLSEVYNRYLKLTSLTEDKIFFNTTSSSWGKTEGIDWIAGTISINNLTNSEHHEINLGIALEQILFFNTSSELSELVQKKSKMSKEQSLKIVHNATISPVSDKEYRDCMFYLYIPNKMTPYEFETWWNKETSTDTATIDKARSIHEMYRILNTTKNKIEITDDILKKIRLILTVIKPTSKMKDFVLWAETVCLLLKFTKKEQTKELIPELSIQEKIWPNELKTNTPGMEIWTNLKASSLSLWTDFTKQVKGEGYLLKLTTYLPWKAWPAITSKINRDELVQLLENTKRLSSPEALLWIWKNKAALPEALLEKINTINLFASFARKQTGAIWNSAVNDLKKLIIESKDFQLSLIKDKKKESHIIDFLERLNNLTSFSKTEKQSIIVKLSRHFPAMKDLFNSGKAKKVLTQQEEEETATSTEERHITSQKSYNEKLAELDDIINVQMPENTKAIATARAHGDLRENAEYAAAKERQKYLTEHRGMLEERILTTVPTDFTDTELTDKVIAGCTVTLSYEDSTTETYHILGAWDSEPSKKYVSYETGMGKALISKSTGDTAILPDGKKCTIQSIKPLTENIKKDLL